MNSTIAKWPPPFGDIGVNMLEQLQDANGVTGGVGTASDPAHYSATAPNAPQSQFEVDAQNGNLPDVSWIVPPSFLTEHPTFLPADGECYLARIVEAVMAGDWENTVLIITYDENDGHFDHVKPMTSTESAAGNEPWVSLSGPGTAGPVGGGFSGADHDRVALDRGCGRVVGRGGDKHPVRPHLDHSISGGTHRYSVHQFAQRHEQQLATDPFQKPRTSDQYNQSAGARFSNQARHARCRRWLASRRTRPAVRQQSKRRHRGPSFCATGSQSNTCPGMAASATAVLLHHGQDHLRGGRGRRGPHLRRQPGSGDVRQRIL